MSDDQRSAFRERTQHINAAYYCFKGHEMAAVLDALDAADARIDALKAENATLHAVRGTAPGMVSESTAVLIWSGEHCGWWRTSGGGYTGNRDAAGRWLLSEARRAVAHCGPEKKISLHLATRGGEVVVPTDPAA